MAGDMPFDLTGAPKPSDADGSRSIAIDVLAEWISTGSVTLVEALGTDFYAIGHLPGASNLPLSSSDAELAALVDGMASPIVVYASRDGSEARELARRITAITGRGTLVLDGGKEAWVEAGHDLERPDAT